MRTINRLYERRTEGRRQLTVRHTRRQPTHHVHHLREVLIRNPRPIIRQAPPPKDRAGRQIAERVHKLHLVRDRVRVRHGDEHGLVALVRARHHELAVLDLGGDGELVGGGAAEDEAGGGGLVEEPVALLLSVFGCEGGAEAGGADEGEAGEKGEGGGEHGC